MVRNKLSSMLLLLLTAFSLKAVESSQGLITLDDYDMSEATLRFSPDSVRSEGIDEKVGLFFDEEGFFVRSNDENIRVHSYDTDPIFKNRKQKDILRFALGNKFKLKKLDNGEYKVEAAGGLKGGGVVGATVGAHVGVVATNVVGHGILMFISSFSGPAAPWVYAGLAASYGPMILATSKAVGVGVGVVAAVATGPV